MRDLPYQRFDVLVVDDEEDNLDAFRFAFRKSFTLHYALGGEAALEALERLDPAVIVSDQRMPGMNGIEFLKLAKEKRPDAFGILLTAYAELAVLIDAVNSGAVDRYVQKPWDSKELALILRQAIGAFATVRENRRLREQLAHYTTYLEREQRDPIDFGELQAESAAMREVRRRVDEVAPTDSPVLLLGEAGTEKEIVARAIHVGSPREERPFVKVTCAAFPGPALERELFGWQKGAFEGAFGERSGRIELAHRGTLFLEDPADPSPELQARLLRLLETGELERVGGTDAVSAAVRLVVAVSAESLEAAWPSVLPELASRLEVFPIRIPPLRERREDIRTLALHFLGKYARRNPRAASAFSEASLERLEEYAFPGNVRELENVVERAAILARGDSIQPEHLAYAPRRPAALEAGAPPPPAAPENAGASRAPEAPGPRVDVRRPAGLDAQLDEIERRELLAALERCKGNKAEVARSLGVQRTTLYYRLKRLGIDV